MRPEAKLEDYYKKQAAAKGFLQYKFISGETGVPDRLLIRDGKIAFVELKALKGVLSARQKFVIKTLRKHKMQVYVPYNKNDIDAIFNDDFFA